MKKAVVLLPTYNEKDNIARFIGEVLAQEKNTPGWKIEVLIADSDSADGTLDLVENLEKKDKRIHSIKVGPGLGVALIEGQKYSAKHFSPDALLQMDSDGQVAADVIPEMLKAIDEGYSLVIGSRFVKGGVNQLSFRRKLFSWGACLYCRIVMGPFGIKEFTNSARAFTPELFAKVDLERIPWREKTFIIQPAFLHQAVRAGAKYKEVPLVFRDRAEGYSKNKTLNYSFDIVTYGIDARLNDLGLKIPFFKLTHKAKTPIKFGLVGLIGTAIDFAFYNLFIMQFGIPPATSKGLSTEVAIVNNFTLNNIWTFKGRKTKHNVWQRFGIFNLVSLGGLVMGVLIVKFLHTYFGDGNLMLWGFNIPLYEVYFFATIPPVMLWNFTVNHFVTWKRVEED